MFLSLNCFHLKHVFHRQPLTATWPDVLSLQVECIGTAASITDFHWWTKDVTVRPAMMRFRPVLKNDNDFDQLVEFLRVRNCVGCLYSR
jgi:hypothetical protein